MSSPVLCQELTFGPDATTQHSYAYFPPALRGQYVELIVYIQFSSGSAAGKIQIQTSCPDGWSPATGNPGVQYGGTWANVGSTIDWAAQSSQKYAAVTGVFADLRLDIDTAITTGTVRAFVVGSFGG